jgi:uncharacterized membrane protein YhaH (DUF805 family)
MDTSFEFTLTGGSLIVTLAIVLVVYVYYAYSLMTIADKTSTGGGWMAWVPILNIYLMCKVAGKPAWWLLVIMFIPIVNLVMIVILWMRIAEARGFPSWWGVLMIVPVINFIVPGYLAFAEHAEMPSGKPIHH